LAVVFCAEAPLWGLCMLWGGAAEIRVAVISQPTRDPIRRCLMTGKITDKLGGKAGRWLVCDGARVKCARISDAVIDADNLS